MAHAKFSTRDGISIDIEGTPEELSIVVEKLRQDRNAERSPEGNSSRRKQRGRTKLELPQLIESLRNDDFFRQPKGLRATQEKLAEMGHHYPLTTLSGAMQAEAKTRRLRRFKQAGKYVYVQ
jgi:hypothetical protein